MKTRVRRSRNGIVPTQREDCGRRSFLKQLGGASNATLLPGCMSLGQSGGPCDSNGIVNWVPDVAHPVFYGVADITPADGAPRNMLIYYPAATFRAPPILKSCIARWPIVLFLHGYPPNPRAQSPAGYYRSWWRIPSTLARCGYVVVVPDLRYNPFYVPPAQDVAAAMNDIDWVRHQWSESAWVDQRPDSTAVAGHSDGAMLSAAVAAAHPELISAMVSLSGVYELETANISLPAAVQVPSFYMWHRSSNSDREEDLDSNSTWDSLMPPKYGCVYNGEHFDYLDAPDAGVAPRGPCPLLAGVASDLVALFISANVASLTQIPIDLTKPQVQLTAQQQTYADSMLLSVDEIGTETDCSIDLRWKVDDLVGSRHLGG